MNIFDCFCGIGPWKSRDRLLPWRPSEIVELLDHFGINRALVHSNMATNGGATIRGNEHLVEACAEFPQLVPAFTFTTDPHNDAPSIEQQFAALKAAAGGALWLCPPVGNLCPWVYRELLGICAERHIPVFYHRDSGSPRDLHELLSIAPGLRLVLVGASYGDDWWLYPLLREFPELRVSLGHFYIPTNSPMRFLEHFSADRLIFGSGLPHFSPGGLIAHAMFATISDADRAKILSGNLETLLKEARP